ncbi:MAG: DNA alkylation repair protein, partial [Acidaminobacteraceae bacterium]
LGSEKTKKTYMSQGAVEPVFGLTIKSMKPLAKRLKKLDDTQQIAYDLYSTGNYDLMYLAGMIVDPTLMSKEKYNKWIKEAYFYMISDYIVAVCLCEAALAEEVADEWMISGEDLIMSAAYSTYSWMLSHLEDKAFDKGKLDKMLNTVKINIEAAPNRTKYSMYYFVVNLGISYPPLSEKALLVAKVVGGVTIINFDGSSREFSAEFDIRKQLDKGRLGFKRKNVRC